MIKEEYQKTLIRMWDSVRDDESKMGQPNCKGVSCDKCPLYDKGKLCYSLGFSEASYKVYDIIAKVEKWLEYNPLKTNGARFLENYPKAEIYNYDDEFIFIRLDRAENHIKIPREWWESEVDDND